MGTWASNNFGNDGACDYLAGVFDFLLKDFRQPADLLEIDEVMAAAAIILAICERFGIPGKLIGFDIDTLKHGVLRIYDAEIDDYCLDPDYKRERREVICRTFNELQICLKSEYQ